ncbi:MAG TPA: lipopolysaccharide biosynthesis protein [Polyangiaceae bacterium]|nr:lipopolysaccharide biosynthesis protein [Polyangiaceae bacterium]
MTSDDKSSARQAGRGGLAIAAAKLYFILVGLAQQIAFGRILGLDGYGALSTALSTVSIFTNPITQASIQAASREVAAANDERGPFVQRRILGYHVGVALVAGAVFLAAAPWLASWLGAPHITFALCVLSSILLIYGIYTPLVGVLNGRRRFLAQAGLDVTAATLRTVGLLLGAWLAVRGTLGARWDGSAGAALGFAVAALPVLALAIGAAGTGRGGGSEPAARDYLRNLRALWIGQFLLNVLFQADGLLLRRFAAQAAAAGGLPLSAADPFVGAYRAAQLFGFLPYQLLMSVTFVLFPLLASARAAGEAKLVRDYVRAGVRLAVLLSGLLVAVLFAVPEGLIRLAYAPEAARLGGDSLRVLGLGLGCLAVLGVMTSALNSLGGERESLRLTALALALVAGACALLLRGQPLDANLLVRCAIATSAGLLLATLACAYLLNQRAGGVVPTLSLARAGLGFGLGVAAGLGLPGQGPIGTLLRAAAVAVVYLGVLVVSRELGAEDWARVRAMLGGRAAR